MKGVTKPFVSRGATFMRTKVSILRLMLLAIFFLMGFDAAFGDENGLTSGRGSKEAIVESPAHAKFVAVAGGRYTSLALDSNGIIGAWGAGYPLPSPNADFVAIAAGGFHNLGLRSDGMITAWGDNYYGQCNVPSPNADFVAVAGGWNHSLGLKSDGTIVAWGSNIYGERNAPSPNADFVAIAAGVYHSLGLKSDGTIVAWGDNFHGQCSVPSPNANFIAIAGGQWFSLGLRSDGTIVAWGRNVDGQCSVPFPNADFTAVAGGYAHSLGLKSDGTIAAWGVNYYGQCNVPFPNSDFVAIAAGWCHSLGLKSNGTIVAWGLNDAGQCNVPAEEDVTLSGTVRNQGVGMAGVTVTASKSDGSGLIFSDVSDENGTYSIVIPEGFYTIEANKEGYEFTPRAQLDIYDDTTLDFQVSWPIPNALRICVRSFIDNSTLIADAYVRVMVFSNDSTEPVQTVTGQTRADGSFICVTQPASESDPKRLFIEVAAESFDPTRIISYPRVDTQPREIDVVLVPADILYESPFSAGNFTIEYNVDTGASDRVFEAEYTKGIQTAAGPRKVPIFVSELEKYLVMADARYIALGLCGSNHGVTKVRLVSWLDSNKWEFGLTGADPSTEITIKISNDMYFWKMTSDNPDERLGRVYAYAAKSVAHELFHLMMFLWKNPDELWTYSWYMEGLPQLGATIAYPEQYFTAYARDPSHEGDTLSIDRLFSLQACADSMMIALTPPVLASAYHNPMLFWVYLTEFPPSAPLVFNDMFGAEYRVFGDYAIRKFVDYASFFDWTCWCGRNATLLERFDLALSSLSSTWDAKRMMEAFFVSNIAKDYSGLMNPNYVYRNNGLYPPGIRKSIDLTSQTVLVDPNGPASFFANFPNTTLQPYGAAYYKVNFQSSPTQFAVLPTEFEGSMRQGIGNVTPYMILLDSDGNMLGDIKERCDYIDPEMLSGVSVSSVIVVIPNATASSHSCPGITVGKGRLVVQTACPIDLLVTDPLGRSVGSDVNEAPNGLYSEWAEDGDNTGLHHKVAFISPQPGDYSITVTPHDDAAPSDSYSVFYVLGPDTLWLAQNVLVENIPPDGYEVNISPATNVEYPDMTRVYELNLHQNSPNPFNPSTVISFELPDRVHVTLSIYDVAGRLVRTVANEVMNVGHQERIWDGKDIAGREATSGVYFCCLTAGKQMISRKMVMLK